MSLYDQRKELYDQMVAACPNIERKGKTMPYTSDNGHMFSLLNKEAEIGIRLSKEDGQAFRDEHGATDFKSHGATMRGYVKIPDHLLEDTELLKTILEKGQAYVMSLPPK